MISTLLFSQALHAFSATHQSFLVTERELTELFHAFPKQ